MKQRGFRQSHIARQFERGESVKNQSLNICHSGNKELNHLSFANLLLTLVNPKLGSKSIGWCLSRPRSFHTAKANRDLLIPHANRVVLVTECPILSQYITV